MNIGKRKYFLGLAMLSFALLIVVSVGYAQNGGSETVYIPGPVGSGVEEDSTDNSVQASVAGGSEATPGEWPWIAALFSLENAGDKDSFTCAGTLIASQWILTTEHCAFSAIVNGEEISFQYDVVLGGHNLYVPESGRVTIPLSTGPQDAAKALFFRNGAELALYKLPEPVSFHPVQVNLFDSGAIGTGSTIKTKGWGHTSSAEEKADALQEVEGTIVSDSLCTDTEDLVDPIKSRELCVQPSSDAGTCNFDSGGPLGVYYNNEWILTGVLDRGTETTCPSDYDIYADLRDAEVRSWILDTIFENDQDQKELFEISFNIVGSIAIYQDHSFSGNAAYFSDLDTSTTYQMDIDDISWMSDVGSIAMPHGWNMKLISEDGIHEIVFVATDATLDNNTYPGGPGVYHNVGSIEFYYGEVQSIVVTAQPSQNTPTPDPNTTSTPAPTATPIPPGIRLCDGTNYSGTCQSFSEGEYPDLDQYGVADWVESVKFDSDYELNTDVWLYREDNFSGEQIHTTGSLGSLGNLANHVRSMKVDRHESTSTFCTGIPDGVTLYSETNYGGDASNTFTTNYSNLGNLGWSDRAQSVRVCGYCTRLWTDADYQGTHTEECSGGSDPDLSDDAVGMDTVSSLEVWQVLASVPVQVSPVDSSVFATYPLSGGGTGAEVTLMSDVSAGATWWEFNLYRYLWDGVSHVDNFYSGQVSTNEVTWELTEEGIYRWHARSGNVHGVSTWTSLWEFQVGNAPTPTPTPSPTPDGQVSVSASDTVVLTSDALWHVLPGMSITRVFSGGSVDISFTGTAEMTCPNTTMYYEVKIDGADPRLVLGTYVTNGSGSNTSQVLDMSVNTSVTGGSHTIEVNYWTNCTNGSAKSVGGRTLSLSGSGM